MTGHSKSTSPPSLTATEATAMSAVATTDAPNATNDNNEGGVNPYSMMHRTLQSKEANYVTHILPNDVLLGRGTGPNDHPGNVTFRNLIKDQFNNYKTACIRGEKTKMAKRVVTYIRNQNGRFLRRLDAHEMPAALADPQRDHHLVEDAEVYLEIKDDRLLVQKTKQAFRHLIRQAGQSTSQSQSPSTSQGAGTGQDQGQGHFAPLSRRSKARSASMSMRSRSRSRSPDTVSSGESGVAPRSYGRARRLSAAASASTSGSVSASVSTSHSRAQLDGAAGLVGHTGTNMDVEMNAGMGVGMGMGMGANGHAQAGAGAAMGESGAPPVSMISIQKSALAPTFSTSSLDSSVGTNSVTHRHATGAAAGVGAPNAMLGAEADIDARLAALRVSGLPGLSAAAAAAAASRPSQLSSLALQHQRQQQLLRQQQQQQQQQRDSQLLKLMAVNDAQLRSRLAKAQLLDALSTPGVSAGGIANATVGNGTGNPSALAQLALASQPSQLAAPMSAPNTSDVLDAALRLAASRKMAALQSALGATAGVGAGVGAGGLGVGAPVSATAAAAASAALAARSGGVVRPGMGDRHSLLLELLAAEQTMRQPAFR